MLILQLTKPYRKIIENSQLAPINSRKKKKKKIICENLQFSLKTKYS